ncbi:MAG: hypothetical protein AAF417_14095 [Pseudomonadota bacterium]
MPDYVGYLLLGAGALLFLVAWMDTSGKSRPLLFVATMLAMGGLAFLQLQGTEAPSY